MHQVSLAVRMMQIKVISDRKAMLCSVYGSGGALSEDSRLMNKPACEGHVSGHSNAGHCRACSVLARKNTRGTCQLQSAWYAAALQSLHRRLCVVCSGSKISQQHHVTSRQICLLFRFLAVNKHSSDWHDEVQIHAYGCTLLHQMACCPARDPAALCQQHQVIK